MASFTITKLAWLKEHEPASWARVARVLVPHDWLTWRLTGRFVTDRGDASGTGWWSPAENRYRHDLLALVDGARDWQSTLPEVLGPLDVAGEVAPIAVRELAAGLAGAIVAPGTGDNMAAALGVGLRAREVVLSLGTSGTVYAVSEEPVADPTGLVGGFADATGRHLPLVCTLNATRVTEAFARILSLGREAFDRAALSAPPGAGGLVLVPYLDGERTPNRPAATGALFGLRSDADASRIARAAFEGVVCGLLDALDALDAAHVDTGGRLLLVGGGARSPAYRRIVADLAQRSVTIPRGDEAVALGACVQAAAVLHQRSPEDVARAWRLGEGETSSTRIPESTPPALRAAYARARAVSRGVRTPQRLVTRVRSAAERFAARRRTISPTSAAPSTGLVMNASQPAAMADASSFSPVSATRAMIATSNVRSSARRRRATLKPSIPGNTRSRTTA